MLMKEAFTTVFEKLMQEDKKVIVLDADLAKCIGTNPFQAKYPMQAIDVGIAEQNMAVVAAGLSAYGFKPYITSFAPFVSRRIADQATISIAYAKRNVKIVGTDPGITAELNGGTHMGLEDVAIMRAIPDMMVFEPCDCNQLAALLPVINNTDKPCYIRIFRKEVADVFPKDYQFDLYKANLLKEGSDVTIIACGTFTREAINAVEMLKNEGINAELINVATIKPLDEETIRKSALKTKAVVTVENHNLIGGLRDAVLEALALSPVPLKGIGVNDRFGEVGKLPYLKTVMGMREEDIVAAAKQVIAAKNK